MAADHARSQAVSPVSLPTNRPVAPLAGALDSIGGEISVPAWAEKLPNKLAASSVSLVDFIECNSFLDLCDEMAWISSHTDVVSEFNEGFPSEAL